MSAYPETDLLLMGVGGALTLSSLIAGAARLRVRNRSKRAAVANLIARVKSWWVMAALLVGAFLVGDKAVIALFAFVSFASLREFLTITPTRRGDRVALLTAFYLVLPVQYWLVWKGWTGLHLLFIPVCMLLVLPILAILAGDTKDFLARAAQIQWGVMICVYCISYVPALLTLTFPDLGFTRSSSASSSYVSGLLAVFLLLVTESGDITQYVFGKMLGKQAIAPAISPSKTVEGLLGGLACATALGAGLYWITPFTRWQAAAVALLIALVSFVGGLVMSAIKRDRGIKDWGHLVAGHGGMLDRVDSLCFAAPLFFHLTRWVLSAGQEVALLPVLFRGSW